MDTTLSLHLPWPKVLTHLSQTLEDVGLEVTQSFDLQSARAALVNPDGCHCPYHGTSDCTCQYMVWLVSRKGWSPMSLVVHGHDDWTYISLASPSDIVIDENTKSLVRIALEELAPVADPPSS